MEPLVAPRPLFLIGNRGTGKTAVAQALAGLLGWQWLDADVLLEERAGRSIKQIFASDGEKAFRDLEAALLVELCTRRQHVIAVGGGVVLRPENRLRLKNSGSVVWLTGDAATLWRRIQADPSTGQRRPDLGVGGLAEVETLIKARAALYAECASLVVDTASRSPIEVAEMVRANLQSTSGLKS
jgi:shikimate kinase